MTMMMNKMNEVIEDLMDQVLVLRDGWFPLMVTVLSYAV